MAMPISPQRMRELNQIKSRNAAYLSMQVRFNKLESVDCVKGDPDYNWKSYATNFGRGGIHFQDKNYTRDPRTGVWFNTDETDFPGMKKGPAFAYAAKHAGARTFYDPYDSKFRGLGENHLGQSCRSLAITAPDGFGMSRTLSSPGSTFYSSSGRPSSGLASSKSQSLISI
eukprot:TRINITY_DN14381_c0_g1_i4.p1 TRINITY_DN14381_c0_g1~~TRINITY_DN14381_c0_g1_i4.p1  ORF type:complete len:171 (+),score=22.88 TRINITY_DN14381_c0_g1_i4:63-575(+)